MDTQTLRDTIARLMPEVLDDLGSLVRIPSIAFPGYPDAPVREMGERTMELARAAGFADAALRDVPWGYPPVVGEIAGPDGSPTVVLYAHYDVQPAPPEQGWTTDPWAPVSKDDGRLYGRGVADDKSGIAIHLATVRALGARPPCTVRLIVEGMEETESNLEAYVAANPDLFRADAFLVADMGNLEAGTPILTTTLRGEVSCIVTVSTLEHPLHSGAFGGPAPDAMMALARLLSTLHDDAGSVRVDGVSGGDWPGAELPETDFRAAADLREGTSLIGSGTIGSRLWSKPSINAIGVDTTTIGSSSNVLLASARAKLSMRIVPGSDPDRELDALVRHLETHAPWGAAVEVERVKTAPPFRCATDGPAFAAARVAMQEAFGSPAGEAGSGGSIPLLRSLQAVSPDAEFILWGAEDLARARIHASDESVDPAEIERMILAQASFLIRFAHLGSAG
ncbi:MAG TPA: M20/M25/M40 family metallo-hydrolase [Actinomycetota bacterium]|nr:M20/M25/M40 family metallo-hydrolase [Actinomycetota bacterium]